MRVAIAVRRLSPRGGLEGNVLALARHLVEAGHEVEVHCQRRDPDAALAATIHRVPAPSLLGETVKTCWFAAAAARSIAARRPDVSFTSGHVHGVDVVRLEGGLAAGYRAALRAAGHRALDPTDVAAERIEALKLARARRVLALSDREREETLRRFGLPPERVLVVRNGVDLARFALPGPGERAAARARFGVEGPAVAFIGAGFRRKGLDRLLRALAEPALPRPLTLLVAGADSRARAFASQAAALGVDARFLGQLADVRPVLAAADALAHPALFEPFGLVVLEALAAGVPAVVSAATGAGEVLPDPAWVVEDCGSPAALAGALARALAAGPGARAACRAAAERWPLEASLARVAEVLAEVAAG